MNHYTRLHNSLIYRRLLPPPISYVPTVTSDQLDIPKGGACSERSQEKSSALCNLNKKTPRTAIPTLLHQAFASCGRVLCIVCLLLACCLTACEREQHEGLPPEDLLTTRTAADSTAAGDSVRVPVPGLAVDTTWAGENSYDFDGRPTSDSVQQGNGVLHLPNDGEAETGDAVDAV